MSAGDFIYSKYEARTGGVYRIRVQPETEQATFNSVANAAPAGAIDQATTARARGSRRSFGATARKVLCEFTGTIPTGYNGDPVSVPILNPTVFDGITPGQTGTYLGEAIQVLSKTAEQLR